ncbi:MAG: alpha/beta hydrolase [Anaerolineae bacterium]
MPSLQSRFARLITKQFLGRKFRKGRSIADWRDTMERLARYQKTLPGTDIQTRSINGIPAEWVEAPGARTDCALLYLHGGAGVMGSPATHRALVARLSAITHIRALVLDYRLAPEHPFPAALQDAVSAYGWLLDSGYAASRLVVGGDSAGGGLALQTLITLRDSGRSLPAAAFFLSPVTDWVRFDGESYATRATVDPMNNPETCKFTAALFVGDTDPGTPLLYPLGMDLAGLPPLCIHVGDDEILLSDSIRLAERARASNVAVELKVWPSMWHTFQMNAPVVPEARRSLEEIGQFVVKEIE